MVTNINPEAIKLTGFTAPTTVGADPITSEDSFITAMQKLVANEDGDNIIHFSYPSGFYIEDEYQSYYKNDVISGILVSYNKEFSPNDSYEPYTVPEIVDGWALMQNVEGKYIIFFEGVVDLKYTPDPDADPECPDCGTYEHVAAMPFSTLKTLTKAELQSALNDTQYFTKTTYKLDDFLTREDLAGPVVEIARANSVDLNGGVYYVRPGQIHWHMGEYPSGVFDIVIPDSGYGIIDCKRETDTCYIWVHSLSGIKAYKSIFDGSAESMGSCVEITEDE